MTYMVAAYAVVWLGLLLFLGLLVLRIRSVRTELVAVQELVHEEQERIKH
jgi:hypothetical protein